MAINIEDGHYKYLFACSMPWLFSRIASMRPLYTWMTFYLLTGLEHSSPTCSIAASECMPSWRSASLRRLLSLTTLSQVKAISDWPQPSGLKVKQHILGFTNYYHKFIHNCSTLVIPITSLTWISWHPEAADTLHNLKEAFLSASAILCLDIT